MCCQFHIWPFIPHMPNTNHDFATRSLALYGDAHPLVIFALGFGVLYKHTQIKLEIIVASFFSNTALLHKGFRIHFKFECAVITLRITTRFGGLEV